MPDQSPPMRWQPERQPKLPSWPVPPMPTAIGRGVRGLCPACGQTHAFNGYLRVVPACANCGAPLGEFRADDAPPYLTIFVTGHVVVPLLMYVDATYEPSVWTLAAIFLPLTVVMALALLRPVKGGVLGLMLKLGMVKDADED